MSRRTLQLHAASIAVAALAALVAMPASAHAEMRTWHSAAGNHTTEAEFVELKDDGAVVLKTKAGKTIDVPLSKLSDADQKFARSQSERCRISLLPTIGPRASIGPNRKKTARATSPTTGRVFEWSQQGVIGLNNNPPLSHGISVEIRKAKRF